MRVYRSAERIAARIAAAALFLTLGSATAWAAPDDICKNKALSHQQQELCKEEIAHANTKTELKAVQEKYQDRVGAPAPAEKGSSVPAGAIQSHGMEIGDLRTILDLKEPGNMTVLLTIVNHGAELDRLVGIYSSLCDSVLIERPVWRGYRMSLETLKAVDLPPGRLVKIQPGKYKVSLVNMKEHMRPNTRVPIELQFEKAGRVEATLRVVNKLLDN